MAILYKFKFPLQEVVWGTTSDMWLASTRRWIKLQAEKQNKIHGHVFTKIKTFNFSNVMVYFLSNSAFFNRLEPNFRDRYTGVQL